VEAELVGVEGLGPIDVADGYWNEFEQEHAGTHGWCRVGDDIGRVGRELGLGRRDLRWLMVGHGLSFRVC
jgi:hypothetical protein